MKILRHRGNLTHFALTRGGGSLSRYMAFFRISDLKVNKTEIWGKRAHEIPHGKTIGPTYSSLNNYFERFQPFMKRLFNRIKKGSKKKIIK